MNKEIKTKWIEALRSGKYKQGFKAMKNSNDSYCCLGVLCDVFDPNGWNGITHDGYTSSPSHKIQDTVNLDNDSI